MKIAIFTDTFVPQVNGVAKTLNHFTDYLRKHGIEYLIFAPEYTKVKKNLSTHIFHFASFPFFLYPECRFAIPNMLHVKSQLIEFKPDIIHVATPFNVGLCGIHYAKKLKIPLVGSYHTHFDQYLEYYDLPFLSPLLWKYMRWFYRPFLKVFVPSEETKEQLKYKGFENLFIWARGVDSNLFRPTETVSVKEKYGIKEKYILSYVGRLAPEKDISTLLDTIKALPPYIQDETRWIVVGDGPSKLTMQKESLKSVTFTGYLTGNQLSEIYAASDLFVFPSSTETFGNVVLEALACGTPVVGANSGGVKNIIKEGKTGYLCEPKNVKSFVLAIQDFLGNDKKKSEMSKEARSYALTQTWSNIFSNLLLEYESAILKVKNTKETKPQKII